MKKYLFSATILSILILPVLVLAQTSPTPIVVASPSVSPSPTINPGTLPDSSLYFLKTWKEKIQLFFTFNAEKKAQQYLRLAELRFSEYQKMLEKGKNQVAEKTLNKYQNQLDRALQKAEELKDKGKDIKNLSEKLQHSTQNRLQFLQENLNKVPDQARQGIQRAIDNSKTKLQRFQERFGITPSPTPLLSPSPTGTFLSTPTPNPDETVNWKMYKGVGYILKYPKDWKIQEQNFGIRRLTYITPKENRIPEDIWIYASVSKMEDLQAQPLSNLLNFFGIPGTAEGVYISGRRFFKGSTAFEGIREIRYAIVSSDNSMVGWITFSIRGGRQRMDYYVPDSEIETELKIFNQILSTFQFSE